MRWGRLYFAVQAVAGAAWWVAVFACPAVRKDTLGALDPVPLALADVPLFVAASALAAFGLRAAAVICTAWTGFVAVGLALYATVTAEAGWGVLIMCAAAGGSVLALCLLLLGRVPTEWMTVGPFAFRAAAPRNSAAPHVAMTFAQTAVFWGFFLVVAPVAISLLEQRWGLALSLGLAAQVAGVVLLVLFSALGVWSALTMSTLGLGTPLPAFTASKLVTRGPYRFVRNPMAVAGIVQGVAVGLILSSWLVVVYAVLGSLLWNYAVRPLEEADLERRFGYEYRRYAGEVRCWVPRLP